MALQGVFVIADEIYDAWSTPGRRLAWPVVAEAPDPSHANGTAKSFAMRLAGGTPWPIRTW
jgi:hypothetical protein